MAETPTDTYQGISTGLLEIDQQLGGGIPWGCLALIEGKHAAGKTVLCQHLTHSALDSYSSVAYYTSETGSPSILSQMASLGLDVMDHFLLDRLRIFPLELNELYPEAEDLLEVLLEHIAALPEQHRLVIVDSLTAFLPRCSKNTLLNFLIECRQLCSQNKSVVLTLDSRPMIETIVAEMQPWCDIHLKLQMEVARVEQVVKALHVLKANGSKTVKRPSKVHFNVQEGLGLNVLWPKRSYP